MARITLDVPDDLVPRFRAILPEEMTAEDAILKLIKLAILDTEERTFSVIEGKSLDQRTRAKRAALSAELGL